MNKIVGPYCIFNQQLESTSVINKKLYEFYSPVYEVIRVINKIPLFLEDHVERLNNSIKLKNLNGFHSVKSISDLLKQLINANEINNGNIRLDVFSHSNAMTELIYFIKTKYPSTLDYKDGIHLTNYYADRENPQIKQANAVMRGKIDELISKTGAYEVLLISKNDEVTEGGRSNIFFIKGNILHSAPEENMLEGITARYVKMICSKKNINIHYHPIKTSELNHYKSCFITGTSPKVLPVKSIDSIQYDVHDPLIREIMDRYDAVIQDYISKKAM